MVREVQQIHRLPMDLVPFDAEQVLDGSRWRSTRPGAITWTFEQIDRLADEMMASLSQRARDISLGNELPKGFKVIQLQSEISYATVKEIGRHYSFLLPLVKEFPSRVPSGFLLTDVWLMLNQKMRMGLVKPALLKTGQHDTVWNHAAKEAKRLKKPMGSLRYLFRNGNEDANLRLYLNTFGWVADAAFELPLHMGEQDPEASAPREFDPEDADASNASDDEPAPRPDHEIRRVLGQGDSNEEASESEESSDDAEVSPEEEGEEIGSEDSQVDGDREGYSGYTSDTEVPEEFLEGLAAERADACNCQGAARPSPSTSDSEQGNLASDNDSERTLRLGEHLLHPKHCDSEAVVVASPAGSDRASSPDSDRSSTASADEGSSESQSSTPMPRGKKHEHATMKTPPPAMPAWMREQETITPPPVPAAIKPEKRALKSKKAAKDGKRKASFGKPGKKRASEGSAAKAAKRAKKEGPAVVGPRREIDNEDDGPYFKTHSLAWVPHEARPTLDIHQYKGLHSYTISDGEAKVEVLLRNKAFYVKQPRSGAPGLKGQLSVGKFPTAELAWQAAKERSGLSL